VYTLKLQKNRNSMPFCRSARHFGRSQEGLDGRPLFREYSRTIVQRCCFEFSGSEL